MIIIETFERGSTPQHPSAEPDQDRHIMMPLIDSTTPECCSPVPPVLDRRGRRSPQSRIGARSCVSFRLRAAASSSLALALQSPSPTASCCPNSANRTAPSHNCQRHYPHSARAPPSEPVPRFPPLRLLGRLPPERVASSISGRRPRTLNTSKLMRSRPRCDASSLMFVAASQEFYRAHSHKSNAFAGCALGEAAWKPHCLFNMLMRLLGRCLAVPRNSFISE